MDFLIAIAVLCRVVTSNPSTTYAEVERKQLKCQQEYIQCVNKSKATAESTALEICVQERIIK